MVQVPVGAQVGAQNQKWKFINREEGEKTPVMVRINGKKTSCRRFSANKYGDHLIEKIENLTKDLQNETNVAMEIFEWLIPNVDEEMVMEEASYKEIYEIISKLRPTKSRGENEVTNVMNPENPQIMTLAVLHLFYWMVRKSTLPQEFKTSRVIPLRIKDKDSAELDSFCPVNDLNGFSPSQFRPY